jgi:hypothetical protein
VLQATRDKVRDCYRRAAEARERALSVSDPDSKESWFQIEEHWILLAQSIELADSLSDFTGEVRRSFKS